MCLVCDRCVGVRRRSEVGLRMGLWVVAGSDAEVDGEISMWKGLWSVCGCSVYEVG